MKLFTVPLKGSLTMLLCGAFFTGETQLFAAIAPLSQKQLDEQSELIVTDQMVAIESKELKSKIERTLGIHRDRIYSIKLELVNFHKVLPFEQDLRSKEFIVVEAWRPATRILPCWGHKAMSRSLEKGMTLKCT